MQPAETLYSKESYFDPEFRSVAVKIVAGECYATAEPVAITTLLGSCVSVCLHDPVARVGGMNHFMLPELLKGGTPSLCSGACNSKLSSISRSCARYGACAMRQLLQQLDELGASRARLAAKVFGAGRVMALATDIGANNAAFALDYLDKHGIPVVAMDLGECCPRKVAFFPATGQAFVKLMRDLPAGRI